MKNWKNIAAKSALGLLLTGVLVCSYILGSSKRSQVSCNQIDITILDSLKTPFVKSESVKQYLSNDYGKIIGMPIDSIDLYRIEKVLASKSAILRSDAYITSKGTLSVVVTQRKPVIEFQTTAYGFYCDEEGFLLPLQPNFSIEALIIDGHIPLDMADCKKGRPENEEDSRWLDNIVNLVNHMNSSIWKDKISQITSDHNGELTLISKIGNESFIFGHPEDIAEKFEKMKIYYERIVADKGEEAYNVVDLRFEKQIICKNTEQKKKK